MQAACPHCGADLAEYDSEAGACQSCGLQVVVEQELYFEVGRNDEGQQYGTFVSASGRVAGKSTVCQHLQGDTDRHKHSVYLENG